MRGVHLTRKLDKAGLIVSWLLHRNRYMRQYYGEHYNRDVQVHNVKNHENFYLKSNSKISVLKKFLHMYTHHHHTLS